MKVTIILSTLLGLGLAAPSFDAMPGLQVRDEAGVGSGCLIYGICKPLQDALKKKGDPSADKSYESCKGVAKAVGKICSAAACTAIVGTLTLAPPAAVAAAAICAAIG
ncbi:hypothetical protein BGZ63DRAFT_464635 [Mariannaea sp. PMI_226]|nr:hypothetical protein BGZ63DRAFT_464635 [Mariannaea sp. PMI_226]